MKNLKELISLYSEYKGELVIVLICMSFSMLFGFVKPFISESIIDKGIVGQDLGVLIKLCGLALAIYFLSSFIEILMEKQRLSIYNGIRYSNEKKSFLHLLKVKMEYYNDKNISNIYQMIKEDISSISAIASADVFQVLSSFLSAIGGGIALFCIEWKLGLVTLLFMPINCLITVVLTNKNAALTRKFIKKNQAYNEWFGDMVNGVKEIRLFGIQKKKEAEIVEKQTELATYSNKQGILRVVNDQTQFLLLEMLSLLLYVIAGIIMAKSGITLGQIVAFQTYALMLTGPIVYGLGMIFQASTIFPFVERHRQFMEFEEEKSEGKECQESGDIVFNNVTFRYDEQNPLLTNLNFSIKKGSKVALLGKNGVGKTTLLNLILRTISPISGEITLSGENIDSYDILSYRTLFEVVSQNVYLFNASIKENICLNRDVSEERFEEVLELVNLQKLVFERGEGYIVGENGSKLSGGQKQKIAIARAIVQERPILILDEATSNLDVETIDILVKLFETELRNNTVICVTHTEAIADVFENQICL